MSQTNQRIAGAILLIGSSIFALGVIGAQLSRALVLGGGYAGQRNISLDPSPSEVYPHWLVIAISLSQFGIGVWLISRPKASAR
jgi:hypothetical protein